MKNKNGRLNYIMNPASMTEKFIVKFSIYVILFILIFILGVGIAETIRYIVFHSIYPESNVWPLYLSGYYSPSLQQEIWNSNLTDHPFPFLTFSFLAIQSIFILGASIWYSRSFLKTFGVFGGLIIIFFIIVGLSLDAAVAGKIGSGPEIFHWINNHSYQCFYAFCILVTLINWILAYFRIPETDIITTKR